MGGWTNPVSWIAFKNQKLNVDSYKKRNVISNFTCDGLGPFQIGDC